MPHAHFTAQTLDDVMRLVFDEVLQHGEPVTATKGRNLEIAGARLEITDPRARLSNTETRGKPFSCLGELCWYLAGTSNVDFVSYYIKRYKDDYVRFHGEYHEHGEVFGAYGPRLFNWREVNQLTNIVALLRRKPHSRQAVIQLFDACDIAEEHDDVPCTCTMQFLLRSDRLHMLTHMRSNDAYLGLPHDVFCFTMFQEIVARNLAVEVGTYRHMVGSLHIYDSDADAARRFLKEGWQSTQDGMPPMPTGDPWPAVSVLLEAERHIRTEGTFDDAKIDGIDPYWADLIRLLQVFRCKRDNDLEGISALRERISCRLYFPFIDRLAQSL